MNAEHIPINSARIAFDGAVVALTELMYGFERALRRLRGEIRRALLAEAGDGDKRNRGDRLRPVNNGETATRKTARHRAWADCAPNHGMIRA